ncbi:hypothetical protein C4J93_1421 [Pseudomonas sp. R2-37-08W]|nr:hypothetical protein C4J93_1421 [Pseudomonas sp. R2-37-08W]AZF20140.1 hypothetical protein C4J91_1374 [Pseudomonas sp. R3-52-08]AZF25471.1 hypothetical protein C4J90_1282 [Pseudomonas sp. R2-60-08W]AZF30794.1 hypothetical protein C4J89_1303 [Pseudomonas sp. R4-35-07]
MSAAKRRKREFCNYVSTQAYAQINVGGGLLPIAVYQST